MALADPSVSELLMEWQTEEDMEKRNDLLIRMLEENIYPGDAITEWEEESGAYPDNLDPNFLPKLMRKREFLESKQKPIAKSFAEKEKEEEEGEGRARTTEEFELSPVQRFVNKLLSPRTPYNSALFFHGVGVGKTCAAVTVCESYLEAFPGRKAFIVAPPNIQEGFKRTIFDKDALTIPETGDNNHNGCTGDIYLQLSNTMKEKNKSLIEYRIGKTIRSRYEFFGYTSLYHYIHEIVDKLPKKETVEEFEALKREVLKREFSNRIIIIDEAHNLRDNMDESEEDAKDDINPSESENARAGKKLTPFLKQVLEVAEGVTLVLMTATPMYNSYVEILFLLNLLLLNDKQATLPKDRIFDVKKEEFIPGGERLLGGIASRYISFMRGENPLTFPIRIMPEARERIFRWPNKTPKGEPISPEERARVAKLPCLGANFSKEMETEYKNLQEAVINDEDSGGLGITNMDLLIQAGNWIYPAIDEDSELNSRIRADGFNAVFKKEKRGGGSAFRCLVDPKWLLEENIQNASGKTHLLLQRLKNCKGVAFVYSRFVTTGALSIALALEANGYTLAGRDSGLLVNKPLTSKGRQCALCSRREKDHGKVPEEDGVKPHEFKPAKYVILTGSDEISSNNKNAIELERVERNIYGEEVKVVLGSQVAGEGLDLRYIREIFVFDSWYHLNKLEQVVGRGIRTRSHALLPKVKRNCTVSLLVNKFNSDINLESVDMYSYRLAMKKAIMVGKVTRLLKQYALDCTLNKDAIVVKDIPLLPMIRDSQGKERKGKDDLGIDINDANYSSLCDWQEKCDYECLAGDGELMPKSIDFSEQDSSTYDEYSAKYQSLQIRKTIQDIVEGGQPFFTFESIEDQFRSIPRSLLKMVMNDIVMEGNLIVNTEKGKGKIIYKNGYYLYQPLEIEDTSIPIAIRLANIAIPRDRYLPKKIEIREAREELEGVVGEGVAKLIALGDEDSEGVWEEAKEWVDQIRAQEADYEKIPPGLWREVRTLKESEGNEKAQQEKLEMVLWIYQSLLVSEKLEELDVFADCVLEFLWDEFITTATKRELLIVGLKDPYIKKIARDSLWNYKGQGIIRLVNSFTNDIEYLCLDSATRKVSPCSAAKKEYLSSQKEEDPLLQSAINTKTTGFKYGYLLHNPKKKVIVFKKGVPPVPKGRLGRGAECAINSAVKAELDLLLRLGTALEEDEKFDLGLNKADLSERKPTNSIRICTLGDLALRYMDKMRVKEKRWFYRTLEATLQGHPLR